MHSPRASVTNRSSRSSGLCSRDLSARASIGGEGGWLHWTPPPHILAAPQLSRVRGLHHCTGCESRLMLLSNKTPARARSVVVYSPLPSRASITTSSCPRSSSRLQHLAPTITRIVISLRLVIFAGYIVSSAFATVKTESERIRFYSGRTCVSRKDYPGRGAAQWLQCD